METDNRIIDLKYNLNVVCFSIDDFYKTASERKKMSKLIHPLFMTRGVPGTHDCNMLYKTIKILLKKKLVLNIILIIILNSIT